MDKNIIMVAIVGGSASGKTWLADRITEIVGEKQVIRVSQDDFYHDLSHLTEADRKKVNFDHPEALDWQTLEAVFQGIQRRETVSIPVYDFATHTRAVGKTRIVSPGPSIVIWDGLWLLRREALRDHWSVSYFIHCDKETRLKRRIERDTKERGRTVTFVQDQFSTNTEPMHREFVESQAPWAKHLLEAPIALEQANQIAHYLKELAVD